MQLAPTPSAILNHISDALVLLDLDGRIVFCNEAFASMVGRGGEQLHGASWAELAGTGPGARVELSALTAVEQTKTYLDVEMPGGDGQARYCLTAAPFKDDAGNTTGVFQNFRSMDTLRDIVGGLCEVCDAIQREKDRTERIVASIADGVFTVGRDLVVRSLSPGMERLSGVPSGEAVGRQCADVFRGTKCTNDCPLQWTFEHRTTVERSRELFCAGGRSLPVSITTALLTEADGHETLVAVVQDLSEIERLRREVSASGTEGATERASSPTAGEEADLRRALEANRWNASRTARALGISRTTLWRKMRRLALLPRV